MKEKQFAMVYKVFDYLLKLSQDKRFKVETDHHYRKNEYVCEIDIIFEEYNTKFRDVEIIWFNDSDDYTADESHFDEVLEGIKKIVAKANKLTDYPFKESK